MRKRADQIKSGYTIFHPQGGYYLVNKVIQWPDGRVTFECADAFQWTCKGDENLLVEDVPDEEPAVIDNAQMYKLILDVLEDMETKCLDNKPERREVALNLVEALERKGVCVDTGKG